MVRRITRRISTTLVLGLTLLWLVLNQTLAPEQTLLGAVLGLVIAWGGATLRPLRARLRRFDIALVLLIVVLKEIIRSNIGVARIVLGLVRSREVRSGFLTVPLELRDPHGLAALAAIITATPGTVWVGLSADGARLTLHVLDLKDEAEWIRFIKNRFEEPLMRIFQ